MSIRYLVFDANCSVCDTLAKKIEASTGGKLQTLSIQSREARALLDQAYPSGWDFAPYLIIVDSKQIKAWKGIKAAMQLGVLLGPRKALRFWKLTRQYGVTLQNSTRTPTYYSQSRRWVLKGLLGFGLGSLFAKGLGLQLFDAETAFANHTCDSCFTGCWDAGNPSWGCTCHSGCGSCPPGCGLDAYHQLWCFCNGQLYPCTWIGCNECACA